MYEVRIPPKCQRFIKNLPQRYRNSAIESLHELKADPYLGEQLGRELKGKHSYRFGVYRIIYKISKKDMVVEILRINHRSRVYN